MRKLNVKLLVGLLVGSSVFVLGVYLLHGRQVRKNANLLFERGEQAAKKGEYEEAMKFYLRYVRHKADDDKGWEALAMAASKAAEGPDASFKMKFQAYNVLEQTVHEIPDNQQVRRQLVDFQMSVGQFAAARTTLEPLIERLSKQTDEASKRELAKLEVLMAKCLLLSQKRDEGLQLLSGLLGYDVARGEFTDVQGRARDQVDAYVLLSMALRQDKDGKAASEAVLDRMVTENSGNYQAYLNRGQYYRQERELERASEDFAEAAKIAPNELEVILSQVDVEIAKKNFAHADELLAAARRAFPRDARVYRASMYSAMSQGDIDRGLALSDEGLKAATDSSDLLLYRAELLLQKRDVEGARSVIKTLREQGTASAAWLNYLDGYLLLIEGKNAEAVRRLEEVREQAGSRPELAEHVNLFLGQAYEALNKTDKALEAYERVLALDPQSVGAKLAKARVEWSRGGNREQISKDLESLFSPNDEGAEPLEALGPAAVSRIRGSQLQVGIDQQLQKPEKDRDWTQVDKLLEELRPTLNDTQRAVLEAEIAIHKGNLPRARQLLQAQRQKSPEDLATWLASANLELKDKGPEAALAMLDNAQQQLGDVLTLRFARISVLAQSPADQAQREARGSMLVQQERGLEKLSADERKRVLLALGFAQLRLGRFDDAVRLWKQAADAAPQDASIRLTLFELARERNDEAGMNAAIEELKRITGANGDETLYAEAARILWNVRQEKVGREALAQAKEKVAAVQPRRANWDKLSRLAAEISLMQGSLEQAESNLRQAVQNNPGDVVAMSQLFRLLVSQRKFEEARTYIANLGPGPFAPAMSKLIAEVQEATGHPQEAKEAAAAAVPDDSESFEDLAWRAALLRRVKDTDQAEKLLQRAVRIAPQEFDIWLAMAEFYVLTGRKEKVDGVVQQAMEVLPSERHRLFQAMAHEALGRTNEADEAYRDVLADRPDDLMALRAAASFNVRVKRDSEAIKCLDHMLEVAGRDPQKHAEDLAWARRVKAQQMGQSGDYQQFLAAVKSLDETAQGGKLGPQEKVLKAMLLSSRKDPESWLAGMRLFEEIGRERPLMPQEKVLLAALKQKAGDLPAARQLFFDALTQDRENVEYLAAYVGILIEQGDADEALQWVDALQRLKPQDLTAYLLRAQILSKQGKKPQALRMLKSLIPAKITAENAHYLREVAGLCEAFGHFEDAQQLLEEYAVKVPGNGTLYLAGFLGRRGRVDEAFAQLKGVLRRNTVLPVTELAIAILRANQSTLTSQQFAVVDDWLQKGLKAVHDPAGSPNPAEFLLKLRLAELRDLQGQYDDVMRFYDELLQSSDLDPIRRAIVLNNQAFLMAVKTGQGDQALKLVDGAIEVLGPTSDLLDTRAMAHLARGDAHNAISDLTLALNGSVEPMKLFHLALAYAEAGDKRKAAETWQQAQDKEFNANELSEPERKLHERLLRQLGK